MTYIHEYKELEFYYKRILNNNNKSLTIQYIIT